jgi:hypothetical protein
MAYIHHSRLRKGKIDLPCPPDWRQGQTILNFLNWLEKKDKVTFHLEDAEWEDLYKEFFEDVTRAIQNKS